MRSTFLVVALSVFGVASLLIVGPAEAEVFFADGFESGDFGAWALAVDGIDDSPPEVIVQEPVLDTVYGPTVHFKLLFEDVSGVVRETVFPTLDGAPFEDGACAIGWTGASCDSRPLSEGPHVLRVALADHAGNQALFEWPFMVVADTTAPTVAIVSPQGGLRINAPPPIVSASYFDGETGVDPERLEIRLDDLEITAGCTVNNQQAFCRPGALADGFHRLEVRLEDRAGNPALAERTFRVATNAEAPAIDITTPVDLALLATATVTVAGTVNDANGVGAVTVNGVPADLDGDAWSAEVTLEEGLVPIDVAATDSLGRRGFASVRVSVDTTPPTLVVITPRDGAVTNLASVAVAGSAFDDGGAVTVTAGGLPAGFEGELWSVEVPLAEGPSILTVEAADEAGNVTTAELAVERNTAPKVSITEPLSGTVVDAGTIQVAGIVEPPAAAVTVNGVAAAGGGGTWTATVPVHATGPTVITAVATDPVNGLKGAASVSVSRDSFAPRLQIDLPAGGSTVDAVAVEVVGLVNDLVPGTVQAADVTVTVNGLPAEVQYRTFRVAGVPLSAGENVLEAVATDSHGNVGRTTVRVRREAPAAAHLAAVGGGGQSAPIGAALAAPFTVEARDAAGTPQAGVAVAFQVLGTDGHLEGGARRLVRITGGDGRATAAFTVGSRAGLANQRLQASADGFLPVILAASAEPGAPSRIFVDGGDQQVDSAGQRLTFPLVAAVTDHGFNRLGGVAVSFQAVRGGGRFADGETTFTASTDASGRATAAFTLGGDDGVANNVVEARIEGGDDDVFATFVATGRAAGAAADTAIEGVVLDNADQPVPGVTLTVRDTAASTTSDAAGYFRLAPVPIGLVHLDVDGTTTTRPGVWAHLEFMVVNVPGRTNGTGRAIHLLPIDVARGRAVTATTGGILTLPEVPGFALEIAPGSVSFPDGSREGVISVTAVHGDKIPMTPNFGQQPRFIITVQPAGAAFDPPARLSMPNTDALPPGAGAELYSFDHDLGAFVSIGPGTVREDGTALVANPGVGILKAGWHCGGNPSSSGTAHDCPQCKICNGSQCVPGCPLDAPPLDPQAFGLDDPGQFLGCSCTQDDPCAIKGCNGSGSCVPIARRRILAVEAFANGKEVFEGEWQSERHVDLVAKVKSENCSSIKVRFNTGDGLVLPGQHCGTAPDGDDLYCRHWEYLNPGMFNGYAEATCMPCTSSSKQDTFRVELFEVEIEMEQIGEIEISADGKYTEDAKIKASAIRTDTGAVYTGFNRSVGLIDMNGTYQDNTAEGADLPTSLSFNAGIAEFTAKSLAKPNGDMPPDPAQLDVQTYTLRNAPFEIEQWVDLKQVDPLSRGAVYDWVEARARDVIGGGDQVFNHVIGYEQAVFPDSGPGSRDAEMVPTPGQPTGTIRLDPHSNSLRIDGSALQVCTFLYSKDFTSTMRHEGRHAYQWALLFENIGTDDDNDGFYPNSDDRDVLVDVIPLAPSTHFLDTAMAREVCDIDVTDSRVMRAYKGDLDADAYKSPDYASWAIEMDAFDYSD